MYSWHKHKHAWHDIHQHHCKTMNVACIGAKLCWVNLVRLIRFGSGFETWYRNPTNLRGSVRIGFGFRFLGDFFYFNRTLLTLNSAVSHHFRAPAGGNCNETATHATRTLCGPDACFPFLSQPNDAHEKRWRVPDCQVSKWAFPINKLALSPILLRSPDLTNYVGP